MSYKTKAAPSGSWYLHIKTCSSLFKLKTRTPGGSPRNTKIIFKPFLENQKCCTGNISLRKTFCPILSHRCKQNWRACLKRSRNIILHRMTSVIQIIAKNPNLFRKWHFIYRALQFENLWKTHQYKFLAKRRYKHLTRLAAANKPLSVFTQGSAGSNVFENKREVLYNEMPIHFSCYTVLPILSFSHISCF